MNQISWQIYGGEDRTPNTFIGGVASVITTSGALSTRLGIGPNRITSFKIVGSDIECRIRGDYSLNEKLRGSGLLTYFIDNDGLAKSFGTLQNFVGEYNMEVIYAPKTTYVRGAMCYLSSANLRIVYMPLCTIFGEYDSSNIFVGQASNSSMFRPNSGPQLILYLHPSLQTINAGNPDPDIIMVTSRGGQVRYVTNFTAPNPITDLSAGTIYGTAIQLNFTAPTGSTNAIDYYEVWQNGVNTGKRITASGQYITGLIANTTYNIELKPVDIFYNKSTSNVIAVTTATTLVYQDSLVSYYKMENNVLDSWGTNNGTNTSVSYVAGKIGNAGSYNGTTSKTVIGNPANLQLSTGSVSCWVKTSAAGSSYRAIFSKENAYGLFLVDGVLGFYNWGSFGGSGFKSTGVNLNDNLWHNLVLVFENNTALNYIYVDGVLKLTFSMSVLNQSANLLIGLNSISQYINAVIDEISIYNTKLTQTEIDLIYNSGNGTTI